MAQGQIVKSYSQENDQVWETVYLVVSKIVKGRFGSGHSQKDIVRTWKVIAKRPCLDQEIIRQFETEQEVPKDVPISWNEWHAAVMPYYDRFNEKPLGFLKGEE